MAKAYARRLELHLNGQGPDPEADHFPAAEGPEAAGTPWPEAVETWLGRGGRRSKTTASYRSILAAVGRGLGQPNVEAVSEATLADYLTTVHRSGASLATVAGYVRVLGPFLETLHPGPSPVTKGIRAAWRPYKTRKKARPHFYTAQEFTNLIAHCEAMVPKGRTYRNGPWWTAFLTLLYECGVRLGEASHLIWQDVDFENGIITIQPHTRLKGITDWTPKDQARRFLPMSDDLASRLIVLQERQPAGIPYVFLGADRYQRLLSHGLCASGDLLHGIHKRFVAMRASVGIVDGDLHSFRRTAITNWARDPNLKPKDVQLLAGHQSIVTTLEIYAMVDGDDVVKRARGTGSSHSSSAFRASLIDSDV